MGRGVQPSPPLPLTHPHTAPKLHVFTPSNFSVTNQKTGMDGWTDKVVHHLKKNRLDKERKSQVTTFFPVGDGRLYWNNSLIFVSVKNNMISRSYYKNKPAEVRHFFRCYPMNDIIYSRW